MQIDLDTPTIGLRQAAGMTSATFKTIDNYIYHGTVTPTLIDNRRLLTPRQVIELELLVQLNDLFGIPPKRAQNHVLEAMEQTRADLERDALAVSPEWNWARQASVRAQVTATREDWEDQIDLIIPVQIFWRRVLTSIAMGAATESGSDQAETAEA